MPAGRRNTIITLEITVACIDMMINDLAVQPAWTTSSATTHFERFAEIVTAKAAELLSAQVFALDEEGLLIASSDSNLVELFFNAPIPKEIVDYLRVPFCVGNRAGEILVGEPLNGELVSPHLAQGVVELVINQVRLYDQLPNHYELKNKFIRDLLYGKIDDEATILEQAKLLGLDFTPPRAVLLIDATDYILAPTGTNWPQVTNSTIQRRARFIIDSIVGFFHLPNDMICAYIGEGEIAVLKASDTKNLTTWADSAADSGVQSSSWANLIALRRAAGALLTRLRADTSASINIGIGRYHPGLFGLAHSYEDARAALSLGRRFNGHNQVYCLDQLGIAAFIGISDERTKIELALHLLSPLDHEPELIETLHVFFNDDCCPSLAATELSIHRNTLSYRLDKIASLTGLDPRRFDDAVQIRLALLMRSLRTEPTS